MKRLTPSTVPDDPYNATTWDGNVEVPTKNAVRDKIESMGAGSANINQTEVDFGVTPIAEQTFTITDASVSVASQIIAQVAWEAPTGKDVDEIEMDDLQIRCKPAAGSFDMFIRSADGSYLADTFKINYLVG